MWLKNLFRPRNMTCGSPWKRIVEFTIPMLLGNLAQQLYNTADSIIVGHYLGDNALAAVGSAGPIFSLLLALFVGVSTGAGIVVSQNFGAKDREKLTVSIANCIILAIFATGLIMILGPLITRPMLVLLGTPDSIIDWCASYLYIYFLGIGGFFFYNMLSGVLRGLGDSTSALVFLLISAVLNIAMDILFVAVFKLGVGGVSLATVAAQAISAILCLIRLRSMRTLFDLNRKTIRFHLPTAKRILKLGIPSGVTQGIMATAGMVVLNLTNAMGEIVIACNIMLMRVDSFAMMPNFSFGQAMSVYTGQNVGAREYDRVSKGMKQGCILAVSVVVFMTTLLLIFAKYVFALFTETTELRDLAVQMMHVMAIGYVSVAVTQVLGGVMRGAGDTTTPMWISFISTILIRIPLAYFIAYLTVSEAYPHGRPITLFGSLMISWILGMLMSIAAYASGKWKKKMYASGESMKK